MQTGVAFCFAKNIVIIIRFNTYTRKGVEVEYPRTTKTHKNKKIECSQLHTRYEHSIWCSE